MGRSIDDIANIRNRIAPITVFQSVAQASGNTSYAEGTMPGHTARTPKFPTRADGYEAGYCAGTIQVKQGPCQR